MFGKNKIKSTKDFLHMPMDTLMVASIFFTLQGEGPYQGQPAVFIRLAHCHLCCSFCDSYFDSGDILTFDEIFDRVHLVVDAFYDTRRLEVPEHILTNLLLVITGGEPLLQPSLNPFLQKAHNRGYTTQVESTGSIYQNLPLTTRLVISPKRNDKTGKQIPVHKDMLPQVNAMKFVVSRTDPNYCDIPKFALDWHSLPENIGKLYVSPMNCYLRLPDKAAGEGSLSDRSEVDERISFWTPGLLDNVKNQENHEHAAELALRYGIKLTLQMQLYASLP